MNEKSEAEVDVKKPDRGAVVGGAHLIYFVRISKRNS